MGGTAAYVDADADTDADSDADGPVAPVGCVSSVGLSGGHSCAIRADDTLWCWGNNSYGVLGIGLDPQNVPYPVQAALPTGAQLVAPSGFNTFAVDLTGRLWSWGSNSEGQLGNGSVGGFDAVPAVIDSLPSPVVELVGDGHHGCVVLEDRTLWCWGSNLAGELGLGLSDPYASVPVFVDTLGSALVDVAAGFHNTCALTTQPASLWCWGSNEYGQIGKGTTGTPVYEPWPVQLPTSSVAVKVTLGEKHVCALTQNGTMWCWGSDESGQLGLGTVGSQQSSPQQVLGLGAVATDLAAGYWHTCALLDDSTVWCWGDNEYAQLGVNGSQPASGVPVHIDGLPQVVALEASGGHTCALESTGRLWCWGNDVIGQLGDGPSEQTKQPLPVEPLLSCEY